MRGGRFSSEPRQRKVVQGGAPAARMRALRGARAPLTVAASLRRTRSVVSLVAHGCRSCSTGLGAAQGTSGAGRFAGDRVAPRRNDGRFTGEDEAAGREEKAAKRRPLWPCGVAALPRGAALVAERARRARGEGGHARRQFSFARGRARSCTRCGRGCAWCGRSGDRRGGGSRTTTREGGSRNDSLVS